MANGHREVQCIGETFGTVHGDKGLAGAAFINRTDTSWLQTSRSRMAMPGQFPECSLIEDHDSDASAQKKLNDKLAEVTTNSESPSFMDTVGKNIQAFGANVPVGFAEVPEQIGNASNHLYRNGAAKWPKPLKLFVGTDPVLHAMQLIDEETQAVNQLLGRPEEAPIDWTQPVRDFYRSDQLAEEAPLGAFLGGTTGAAFVPVLGEAGEFKNIANPFLRGAARSVAPGAFYGAVSEAGNDAKLSKPLNPLLIGVSALTGAVIAVSFGAALHGGVDVLKTAPTNSASLLLSGMCEELQAQAKQLLFNAAQNLGLSEPGLELAGIPRGYFDAIHPDQEPKIQQDFFAMSKRHDASIVSKGADTRLSSGEAFRGDHDFHSRFNLKGRPKAHFNDAGDLVPPNPEGLYKGRAVTIAEHIVGGTYRGAKANSPYISFGTAHGVIAKYGGKGVRLDLASLRTSIAKGELKGVEIVEHDAVLKAIEESDLPAWQKKRASSFAKADKEILVKGTIPKKFLKVVD